MSQSSNELSQELAVLSDVFSDLGERLLNAARQLHNPGAPPSQPLLEELAASRRDFAGLRDRARQYAGTLQLALPSVEALDTLQGLTTLLDEVAEAEIRQAKVEEIRGRALSILDRVLKLSHAGGSEFAPLRECQDGAHKLRTTIAGATWAALPADAGRIAEGDHATAHLLALIEDRNELSDDLWSTLHESVGNTFGKPLAAAAARSKIVLSGNSAPAPKEAGSTPPSAPENRPPGPSDKGPGKRNPGRPAPSSR